MLSVPACIDSFPQHGYYDQDIWQISVDVHFHTPQDHGSRDTSSTRTSANYSLYSSLPSHTVSLLAV